MSDGRLVSPGPSGLPAEPSVQFCDFCHDAVYRTLLVRVGGGDDLRVPGAEQLHMASEYRKACPPCADRLRDALWRAQMVDELGRMLEEMVAEGATQRELDEYIVGWGLDRDLVRGFGVPEPDTRRYR